MQCLSPITLKAKKAMLAHTQIVPCGKCVSCLERRRADWSIRLREEMRVSERAIFLTLTYNEENVPFDPDTGALTLDKTHLQAFFKLLKQNVDRLFNSTQKSVKRSEMTFKIKYFAQGEYGSKKDRPHYHAIIFNLPSCLEYLIEKTWSKGFVRFGEVNDAVIHYCTKYMITKYDQDFSEVQKPFALMSKGLGGSYIERNAKWHNEVQSGVYTALGGQKYPLPHYFRNKMFDKDTSLKIGSTNYHLSVENREKNDKKLMEETKSPHEFYLTKHQRVSRYTESRLKFLNKKNKL